MQTVQKVSSDTQSEEYIWTDFLKLKFWREFYLDNNIPTSLGHTIDSTLL